MSSLSLVVLAAGMGSRFGGNKHAAAVGPQGQCLFEYSVADAVKAGFDHIVFVVNPAQNTDEILNRLHSEVDIEFVVQSNSSCVPADANSAFVQNRAKPWGTAHAVLVCQHLIQNPFAVVNADDYYGAENFVAISQFLQTHRNDPTAAVMPGYLLRNTLSRSGGVNRGVCQLTETGYLEKIVEVMNISETTTGLHYECEDDQLGVTQQSTVSMNFWGLQPAIFKHIQHTFDRFLMQDDLNSKAELVIPDVIDYAIKSNALSVKVLPTNALWQGLTYAEDIDAVRAFIVDRIDQGDYPELTRLAI